MSFSFNFDGEGASADTASSLASAALDACADCSIHTDSCEISCPVYVDTTACNSVEFLHYKFGELTIAHISAPFRVTGRIDATHDLIPGQYEGGLKIWECSIDLAVYFVNHPELHGCSVLELGCGHGIPGLAALLSGCRPVIFSDFNDTVCPTTTVWVSVTNLISPVSLHSGAVWHHMAKHRQKFRNEAVGQRRSLYRWRLASYVSRPKSWVKKAYGPRRIAIIYALFNHSGSILLQMIMI